MSTHSYTLAELDALGVSSISITYRSLEADTASLRCPCEDAHSTPLPWAEGDRIIICDERAEGSPRIFNGRVKTLNWAHSGSSYALTAELANAVDVLKSSTYASLGASGELDYGQSFYLARAAGESSEGERLSNCRAVCEACFDWPPPAAMDCTRDVRFEATIMGVAGTGSQSCWSLIRAAVKWVPDACTAMRYSEEGDVLQFLTSRTMEDSVVDILAGRSLTTSGAELCTFDGVESCELRARHDLVPPVCALTGRLSYILPEGGSIREPGAFLYHVRKTAAATAGVPQAKVEAAAKKAAAAYVPWQKVLGRRAAVVPATGMAETELRQIAQGSKEAYLQWWQGFGSFVYLKKFGAAVLYFGRPQFEAVSLEDAYPNAGEDGAPANYEVPTGWSSLYLLTEGRFPASATASKNVSGLKWCRGKLTQYVWIKSVPSSTTKEELFDFFEAEAPFYDPYDGGKRKKSRYTRLTVEGVWINCEEKEFQELTNKEKQGAARAVSEDAVGGVAALSADGLSDPAYEAALRSYYEATRKLYHDGSITLLGVTGNPGAMLATGINVVGLRPEWESMATPCDAISYDPITRRATLRVGSRELLSMDERLHRQSVGQSQAESRQNGEAYNPQDSTPDSAPDDSSGDSGGSSGSGGDSGEETEDEYISPSISAYHSAEKGGQNIGAWEVYAEGNKWMLNGGKTAKGIDVEPTDITNYHKAGRTFYYATDKTGSKVILRYQDN